MGIKSFVLKPFLYIVYFNVRQGHIWESVSEDLKFWSSKQIGEETDSRSYFIKKMLYDPKFRTLFYYRYKYCKVLKKILPPATLLNINPATEIAPGGLFFVHPWCTRVGAKKIGKHCIIRHQTTIGSNGKPDNENQTPIIGNNVDIGCMCGIFGNITIGNNVKIGAGTILTKNVPDNCVVVGNPARIIKQDGERVNLKL